MQHHNPTPRVAPNNLPKRKAKKKEGPGEIEPLGGRDHHTSGDGGQHP